MAQMLLEASNVAKVGRRTRRPQHPFHLRTRAFQIQPFCIAPVLAGETLKNILLQSRVVTDPIKNPLIGWWKEYYYFYVKLTDLDFADNETTEGVGGEVGNYVKMLLGDPAFVSTNQDYTELGDAALVPQYAVGESMDYLSKCTALCVDHYFRDEAEMGTAFKLDGMHLAMINNTSVLDSAVLADDYQQELLADQDLDDGDGIILVSEVDEALRRWQWARTNGLTDATYDDYLASFGIAPKSDNPHRPELLRYVKQWQYPSNTVEPTTGVPSSAVSWSIQERADKDRFFKEPGFVLGLTCCRPKVYLKNQTSYMSGWLNRAEDWLPAALWNDSLSSMKRFDEGTGPFAVLGDERGYWLDMRDLFLYGDQFVNFALTETDAGLVALPTATLEKKFVTDADVDALFVAPSTKQFVKEDGMSALTILGSQRDYTATT